ncbi:MAG: M48 family metalloprotease [Nannocystaceae bacterium]|nr:M48 family metalloprotease [Nannocystaceae bacterium]
MRIGPRSVFACTLFVSACSLNPATGGLQAFLISEREEVELGRKSDEEITSSMRALTEAPALVAKVEEVGAAIAEASERPELPWTFRVLDDPAVNAFALPGGFVYVTRGLLTHLNSEAELAGVLGHEVGHVTARHGAVKLRKTAVARRSVGVFRVVDPGLRHIGGFAAGVAGLALLKYSRDDEYQADDLALRYVAATGYDPGGVPEVFAVLAGVAETEGRVPTWLSTHPEPDLRRRRVAEKLGKSGLQGPEPEWVAILEGVVYGRDARDGFMQGQRYVQPRAGFRVELPPEWIPKVETSGMVAVSPDDDALFILGPSDEASASEALTAFFAETKLAQGEVWEGKIGGSNVVTAAFSIKANDGSLTGLVAFAERGPQVVAMIAAAPDDVWAEQSEAIAAAVASFRPLTDPALRNVQPMRIKLQTLSAPTTLAALNASAPSSIPVVELARINHVAADETLDVGRVVKRVEGFNPEPAPEPAPEQ